MDLILVRHAIAEALCEGAADGPVDELRALSRKGIRRMRLGAAGLVRVAPDVDLILTSPLTRAIQTAEILAAAYRRVPVVQLDLLMPNADPELLSHWLSDAAASAPCVVSHQPYLGRLVSWLLATDADIPFVDPKKGSALRISLSTATHLAGNAQLQWYLAPEHLRRLAERRRRQ